MALDPSIALQGRVPQFVPPQIDDPLTTYNKFAQIESSRNQNALAQLQLNQARRADESANAMSDAYRQSYDPSTNEVNYNKLSQLLATGGQGSAIPGIEMGRAKLQKEQASADKEFGEAVGERMKLSKQGLEGVRTPEEYIAWHEANHRDPVLGRYFAQMGITADQTRSRIMARIQQGPEAFQQLINESKLGIEKTMERHFVSQNLGGMERVLTMSKYGGGQADVVPGSAAAVTASPNRPQTTVVNLPQKVESAYGQRFGTAMADEDIALRGAASKAPETAANADRIDKLLKGGKVITGSYADARLQLAKLLNVAGANNQEKIANTEVLVAGLAQNTLDAIKTSGLGSGQGFTDTDRKFLERAVGGNVTLDTKSLQALTRLSRKAAEATAQKWNTRVTEMPDSALQGTGVTRKPVTVPSQAAPSVPRAAIDDLKANPSGQNKAYFDQVFGQGAADRALKGK